MKSMQLSHWISTGSFSCLERFKKKSLRWTLPSPNKTHGTSLGLSINNTQASKASGTMVRQPIIGIFAQRISLQPIH
ncbi:MAG: hypothetical protein ACON42_07675 [Flavobacteriaceae bacterium]